MVLKEFDSVLYFEEPKELRNEKKEHLISELVVDEKNVINIVKVSRKNRGINRRT